MSMTPVIFTDVPYILTAVGLYVNDYCDLYGRGTGLNQEPQLTNLLSNCSVSGFCMFQDSVPAGSYNDPFLSSVCAEGFLCKMRFCVTAEMCV